MTDLDVIEKLIDVELEDAGERFGDRFHSAHEAWAVLVEEIEEAEADIHGVRRNAEQMWLDIRSNLGFPDWLMKCRASAVHGIRELIQVAAMCDKMERGFTIEDESHD